LSLSKKDLANNISKKLELSLKDSTSLTNFFIGFLVKNHNETVSIGNFGTFFLKKCPQRIGRNPKTGEEYIIKSRKKTIFIPSDRTKKTLN
tara:strand:+ start:21 stop:293 length:273 start_codon:yes stop_codon:yes gene_type:complete